MLPNLAAEVAFWQKAFGLDDWTIEARHVENLRYPCNDAGAGYPAKGERMAGLCDADRVARTARIRICTPRTFRQLRQWPEAVCHEVMHVLGAACRTPGWTIQNEHRSINIIAPMLVKAKRKDPALAARAAEALAEAYRRAAAALSPPTISPIVAEADRAAAMSVSPPAGGAR
ncbi:hypothetical protein [Polyangium sp. 15x6]|uniref:hypothetical protein n=1 Tax=Polyangium sp. 15x6 TaxID=3042687 RepID=UPI00249A47ED|nr:hypothetical protein [Polyangium sp. 15x6]MDI3290139.1 hypothetical protein [Polyangium sp. 15x6]